MASIGKELNDWVPSGALREFVAGYDWLANRRDLMWHTVRGVEWTPLTEPEGPVTVDPGPALDWARPFTVTVTVVGGREYRIRWMPDGTSTITTPGDGAAADPA